MKQLRRIRELMEIPGRFAPGQRNSITDVPGVTMGHFTLHEGTDIHTGVTVIKPHGQDIFQHKVPAAVYSANGFGKMVGGMQIQELGEIESYIGLTNTLSAAQVVQGLLDYHVPLLKPDQRSINITVGETNDSNLSDIKGFHIRPEHVAHAIEACSTEVEEGAVGAGAGTCCYGYKGGIGTASRLIPETVIGDKGGYTIGALAQTNFGGNLSIYGHQLPYKELPFKEVKGSCMIIVATDAPVLDRQLYRIAKRAMIGLTNTGSFMSHGSGDFVIAFSNNPHNLRDASNPYCRNIKLLDEEQMNPLFEAVVEAVQEAIYNSMTMSPTVEGIEGRSAEGLDLTKFRHILPLKETV